MLQNDEELYKIIAENIQEYISILDDQGFFLFASKPFQKYLGYPASQLSGSSFFNIIHTDDRDRVIALFHDSQVHRKILKTEFRIRNNSNHTAHFETTGKWMKKKNYTSSFILLVSRNIDDRKKNEKLILESKELAEQATRQKTQFLSTMAHEIRTPLNVILGYSSMLKEIYSDYEPMPGVAQYFNYIDMAGKRLLNTITQILDISRIEAGEFPVIIEPVNLSRVLKNIYELMSVIAEEKKLSLSLYGADEPVIISGDEYCLNGLFTNLISNAIKYSNSGEIRLTIYRHEYQAEVLVADQGIGMDEEYQMHLFETFKQEDNSLKRRNEGAGLGLSLSKKYTELMHGSINIKSKRGMGTTIRVRLPLAEARSVSGQKRPENELT